MRRLDRAVDILKGINEDIEEGRRQSRFTKYFNTISIIILIAMAVMSIGMVTTMSKTRTYRKMVEAREKENSRLENIIQNLREINNIYADIYNNEIDYEKVETLILNSYIEAVDDKYGRYTTVEYSKIMDRIYSDEEIIIKEPKNDLGDLEEVGRTTNGEYEDMQDEALEALKEIREYYQQADIVTEQLGDVAYIKLKEFNSDTAEQFINSMKKQSKRGIDKFIIDLRGNPGGELTAVVKMVDAIVSKGTIVEILEYTGGTQRYKSDRKEIPGEIVILINEDTASAAEIFTQTIREFGRATVVGRQSYGKGTVTGTIEIGAGELTISIAEYQTKDGTRLEGVGVIPDIIIEHGQEKIDGFEGSEGTEGSGIGIDKYIQTALKILRTEDGGH